MSADAHNELALSVLAKAPIPGKVKTRLVASLGAEAACRLHERLLKNTIAVALATTSPRRITLWTALDHGHPLFLEIAKRHGIELHAQPEGDLGERMHHALEAMGEPGLLIGSDCPVLTPVLLRSCRDALASVDAVFLPAEDGGYALVGLNRPEKRLFADIDWGTERVMEQTRHRIAALGWQLACPAVVWDVDRPEDTDRLARDFPGL